MGDIQQWSGPYTQGNLSILGYDGTYFYFPNNAANNIIRINADGSVENSNWSNTLQYPQCCLVIGDYLYVSNFTNYISKILISNPASASTNLNWASVPTNCPSFVKDGDFLYVVCFIDGSISKVSLIDRTTTNWLPASTLNIPLQCTLHNGFLYIANIGTSIISKISLTNKTISTFASSTQGINQPAGVAAFGNYLYVSNYGNGKICKILLSDASVFDPNWKIYTNGTGGSGMNPYNNYLYVYNLRGSTSYAYYISKYAIEGLPVVCFKEGSKILTDEGYKLIQDLRKGDLVKTVNNGFLPIDMIGKRDMYHPASKERIKDQLYKCTHRQYPELFDDLIITGCHSILVDDFVSEEEKEKSLEVNGKLHITDNKFRVPACVDERAYVYEVAGTYTIYHLALENEHYTENYGIYANGLLVETCSKRYLKELSNMELI